MSQPNTRNYTNCPIDLNYINNSKLHKLSTVHHLYQHTQLHQTTTMYTKLQKLHLTVKVHTSNYTILLYITPNYISYLKLGQLHHYTKVQQLC